MYSLKYRNTTNSIYEITCSVVRPCFNLKAGDEIVVLTGCQPKVGELILIRFKGARKIARTCKIGVELPDGTVTPFAELIGVVT